MFERVIGQAKAKRVLSRAIKKGYLSHAYLFQGLTGVGKTTMAKELAMVLNCKFKTGCGECNNCYRIKQDLYPDVLLLKPEGPSIKIDKIRALTNFMGKSSYEGGVKVGIVCQAEKMRDEAANCLLKTLEEPPENSFLILTTENQYAVLPTIRSRTQRVDFQRLTTEEITDFLINKGVDPVEALKLAEYSGGSLGKALSLQDSPKMRDLFQKANRVLEDLTRLKPHEIIALSSDVGKDRMQTISFLDLLGDALKARGMKQDFSLVFGKQYSITQIAAILKNLEELKLYIEGYGNAQLALEGLFIRICRLSEV